MESIDSAFWMGAAFTITLAFVTWQAARLGNDRRDVGLLGAAAALSGFGTGVIALT